MGHDKSLQLGGPLLILTLSQCLSVFPPDLIALPPSGHGPMFHCRLLSLHFKVSVEAYCWGCLWGCPVPTGSRPPCCPPPRESCGPESEGPAAGLSSQSRSSTPWPSLRHHAQTTRSCPRPAVEKPVRQWWDHITNVQIKTRPTGLFRSHENWMGVSPHVSWRSASAQGPIEVPPTAAGRVSKNRKINVFYQNFPN